MKLNDEQKNSQKKRSISIAFALIIFIISIYCVTIFKMGAALFV